VVVLRCTSSSLPDLIPEDVVDVVLVASNSILPAGISCELCSTVLYHGLVLMRERCLGEGAAGSWDSRVG